MDPIALRGRILYFTDSPAAAGGEAVVYHEDGLLWVEAGRVRAVDDHAALVGRLPASVPVRRYPNHLIVPGFIDAHLHYPQTEMIGAWGARLLDWLETYTFPVERKFADSRHAADVARRFLDELLRNGTTTAAVFCSVHRQSVEALFAEARKRSLRLVAGKVLMDRHVPADLRDTAEQGYAESRELIRRWHGVDRLGYAVTPRFAPTSTPRQLTLAGRLLDEFPGVYLQTHIAETAREVTWVGTLFPEAAGYADVYRRHGLLGRRSLLGHGIHLDDDERRMLADSGASIVHCPTSNLFLGSGLFSLRRAREAGLRVALATDVGAGTSFSMFQTMQEAYKIQQLQGEPLDALEAWYLATLGGARALDLEGVIGSLCPGAEADFLVLDLEATPLLRFRLQHCRALSEMLFVLIVLGDDRLVAETWVLGQCRWQKTLSTDGT